MHVHNVTKIMGGECHTTGFGDALQAHKFAQIIIHSIGYNI